MVMVFPVRVEVHPTSALVNVQLKVSSVLPRNTYMLETAPVKSTSCVWGFTATGILSLLRNDEYTIPRNLSYWLARLESGSGLSGSGVGSPGYELLLPITVLYLWL